MLNSRQDLASVERKLFVKNAVLPQAGLFANMLEGLQSGEVDKLKVLKCYYLSTVTNKKKSFSA